MLKPKLRLAGLCAGLIFPLGVLADTAPKPLQQLIQQLWQQSPEVAAAQAAIAAARSQANAAGQPLYNPSLQLDAERGDLSSASIGLSQTLDWHNKRAARQRMARDQITVQRNQLHQIKTQLASEALLALSDYQTAQQLTTLAEQRSQLMQRFSASVQRRYRAGDMRLLETALAKLAYNEALMQQASQTAELSDKQSNLLAVMRDEQQWPQLPVPEQPTAEKFDQQTLLENLPELQLQRAQLLLAKNRVIQAQQERQADPTLGISGGGNRNESRIGLSLEIPLLIRNDFSTEVKAAQQAATQAEQLYFARQRRLHAQLKGALKRLHTMQSAWQQWTENGQPAHHEQKKWLDQLWQANELSASDYLIQAKQSVDTQIAAASLKGDLQRAYLLWLSASGQVADWLDIKAQNSNSGDQP